MRIDDARASAGRARASVRPRPAAVIALVCVALLALAAPDAAVAARVAAASKQAGAAQKAYTVALRVFGTEDDGAGFDTFTARLLNDAGAEFVVSVDSVRVGDSVDVLFPVARYDECLASQSRSCTTQVLDTAPGRPPLVIYQEVSPSTAAIQDPANPLRNAIALLSVTSVTPQQAAFDFAVEILTSESGPMPAISGISVGGPGVVPAAITPPVSVTSFGRGVYTATFSGSAALTPPGNRLPTLIVQATVTGGGGSTSQSKTIAASALVQFTGPLPPSGCSANADPLSLAAAGGAVRLGAVCSSPPSGVSYSWTKNGAAFSGAQNPTDPLPANTTSADQKYVYRATACLTGTATCTTITPDLVVTVAAPQPPTAPSGCSASADPSTLNFGGGTVQLRSSCTSPASGVGYSWTKNGTAFSTAQNPTDPLPLNSSVSDVRYTYVATACLTASPQLCTRIAPDVVVTVAGRQIAMTVAAVSAGQLIGTASQPLGSLLIVSLTDSNNEPVTGGAPFLQGFSTSSTDVISPATEVPGTPGRYSLAVTLGADPGKREIRVCLTTAPAQCAVFAIATTQQVAEQAKTVIGPQAVAAITTTTQQLANIQQRLDNLRTMRNPAVAQGLKLSVDGRALPPLGAFALAPLDKDGRPLPQTGGGASADSFERWGVFVQGDVDIGKADATPSQPGFDIRTKGLTLGADYRFAGNHVLGASLGFTKADTDLAQSGGSQDVKGWSVSLFGEYAPNPNAYVDLALNFGWNKYDTTRLATDVSQLGTTFEFDSSPRGRQFGVALSAGWQFYREALTLTPYGRVEYVDASIDAFTESGNPNAALQVSSQRYENTVLTAGGMAQYAIGTSWGVLVPYARVEYQYAAQTSARDVDVQVIGIGNSGQALAGPESDRSYGNFSVGATIVVPRGLSGYFNFQYLFGRENFSDSRYTLGLRYQF